MNALPDFLIVGAMKAGTTTLYRDLSMHPGIYLPPDKEPNILLGNDTIESIRRDYASLFRPAGARRLVGEASTAYTKRPTHSGIVETALRLCGPNLKILYIRRDPIARIVSQYRHEWQRGSISEPFAEALRTHSRLVDYSRYDWQIAPWIATFGENNVLQLELESYSQDRMATLGRVLGFLDLNPVLMPAIDAGTAYNTKYEQKRIPYPLVQRVISSHFYRRMVGPAVPWPFRAFLRKKLLPPPKLNKIVVCEQDRRYIEEKLAEAKCRLHLTPLSDRLEDAL